MKKHFIFFFLDDFHLIMESGHFYNFSRGIHKEHVIKIIPLQLLAWIIFVGLGIFLAIVFGF